VSEYADTLRELAALPESLEHRLDGFKLASGEERRRREREIEAHAAEHRAVIARLGEILERARAEGVEVGSGNGGDGEVSSDPVEYASQLVGRLEATLDDVLHTRQALAAEESRRREEERRGAKETRRRREAGEQSRERQWTNAREGSWWLAAALAIEAIAGAVAGVSDSVAAAVVVPLVAALVGVALAARLPSELQAWAVWRASGTMPATPAAPPRESRLALVAYAGASAGLTGLLAAGAGLGSGGAAAAGALMAALGLLTAGAVWVALPRRG
jgi:hypothetical protein